MKSSTLVPLSLSCLLAACAALDDIGGGDVGGAAYDSRARVTRATIYKKIDPATLRRARGPGTTVKPSALVPAVGAGMADLVASALERLLVDTDQGQALLTSKQSKLSAFVLHTEDDRDVTVLSDYKGFAPGGCVKLFESPRRRDYPRIAPASGCMGVR